jgi:hypothetical protein
MKNTNDGVTVEPMLLNTREAARKLGICEKTRWTMAQKGLVKRVPFGRRRLYDPRDLQQFIEHSKRNGGGEAAASHRGADLNTYSNPVDLSAGKR